jgi:hypothetical protein
MGQSDRPLNPGRAPAEEKKECAMSSESIPRGGATGALTGVAPNAAASAAGRGAAGSVAGDVLLIATFAETSAAGEGLARLRETGAAQNLAIKRVAQVWRDAGGRVTVEEAETGDDEESGLLGRLIERLLGTHAGDGAARAAEPMPAGVMQAVATGLAPGGTALVLLVALGSAQAAATVLLTLGADVRSVAVGEGFGSDLPGRENNPS